ncbi:NADH dehydrogenase [ubiquinone] 1 beta subcomplex subunit 5, mitochondrial-like [Paramacrobiotus metropolitanus]|uniref:NADH dehydrogenase [ubiquinone] 1 beta subcomplex subunit 5, mitochondrial-like n=1 Tax=Paramacrobiotus metropolitanus TaxID=2943436 RepID=UPI002445DF7E|nr:NADH dehydrogenase [ubiquinone] 1 beta subcomplex subunit 5, mitochondrial-like [Paramacrobiotus metropolitanus]
MALCLQGLRLLSQRAPTQTSRPIFLLALRSQSSLSPLAPIRTAQHHSPLPIVFKRNMAGKRLFVIMPSRYVWRRWKQSLHFFIMLGVIPLTAFTTYLNMKYGEAELAEIPEGYYPKEWEYHKNPTSRFLVKYWIQQPQEWYERLMHIMSAEMDKMRMSRLENKIDALQTERQDYQGYFWARGGPSYYQEQHRDKFQRYFEETATGLHPMK